MDYFDQVRLKELLEEAQSADYAIAAGAERELLDAFLPKLIERVEELEGRNRQFVVFNEYVMPSMEDRIFRSKDGGWLKRVEKNELVFEEAGPPVKLVKAMSKRVKEWLGG